MKIETRESRLAKFLMNSVAEVLKNRGYSWKNNPIPACFTAETFDLYDTNIISKASATIVLNKKIDLIEDCVNYVERVLKAAKEGKLKELEDEIGD